MLEEKVRELIEQRNGSMKLIEELEQMEPSLATIFAMDELQQRAVHFEEMLVELGNLVGVECLQSGGK